MIIGIKNEFFSFSRAPLRNRMEEALDASIKKDKIWGTMRLSVKWIWKKERERERKENKARQKEREE